MSAYSPNGGASEGEYIATVEWRKVVANEGRAGKGPNVIPAEYGDPKKTTLKYKIGTGDNTINLDIKYPYEIFGHTQKIWRCVFCNTYSNT